MNPSKTLQTNDQLNLVVYKDEYPPRVFRFPESWLKWIVLLTLGLLTSIGTLLFFWLNSLRHTAPSDPAVVADLRKSLEEVTAAYESLREQNKDESSPQEGAPTAGTTESGSTGIQGLPIETRMLPTPKNVPIEIQQPALSWQGSYLQVKFNIVYVAEDGGSQQGRIVILAKGQDSLFGYPTGIINPRDPLSVVDTGKGEYFSLSRLRNVSAKLGPIASPKSIQAVQVYLFNRNGAILLSPTFPTQSPPPAPTTPEEPAHP